MSSFGQGWKVKLSGSMMVPTGNAFLATSTLGPTGTDCAAACCEPAPANIFLAMTAVMTATTSAPTSSASFFTSMARSPPPNGPLERPYTSDKLVKKALGENRQRPKSDGDSVRNFGPSLAPLRTMPGHYSQRQHATGYRHKNKEFYRARGRKPQRQGCGELDVAAAHHAGEKGTRQQHEHDRSRRELDCHSRPGIERNRHPVQRGTGGDRRVEPVGNGERPHVDDRRHDESRGERQQQQIGKPPIQHDDTPRRCGFPIRNQRGK